MAVTALWIGDSFTHGEGAGVPAEQTYPHLVSARLGWACRVDAQSGTGFLNDGFLAGPGLAPLIERLPAAATGVVPDIVVVDAGRNDGGYDERELRAGVTLYLAALRAAFQGARLVIVLPTLLERWQPPQYGDVADALREAGSAHEARIVDPSSVQGFAKPGDKGALVCLDGFHPSAAGQAHYADILTTLLRGLRGFMPARE